MIPAVRVPASAKIRTPIEVKLKPGWEFDATRRVFVSDRGETFQPRGQLPKNSKIVYKTPALATASRRGKAKLSGDERNLLRYLQIILPADEPPANYMKAISDWPVVAEASLPPDVSLPGVNG